jgi:imidazolonepropionase-like amidohydrolase/Tol biopolymer transport system component
MNGDRHDLSMSGVVVGVATGIATAVDMFEALRLRSPFDPEPESPMNDNKRPLTLSLFAVAALLVAPAAFTAEAEEEDSWDVNDPPGGSRSISIDTDTGTWMSVDVSPDGETIAFDLLGDIYLLPVQGGEARAIDNGLSWSMQPRFSPDGSEIAYTSDAGGGNNIWIMQADGSDKRQLTHEDFRLLNNPWWSPDGDYIAARKHFTTERSLGTGEIWIYHRNGGDGVAVVERPGEEHQKELGEPAISPDGRYIYYSFDSTPGSTFVYAQDSNDQIFEIRRHDFRTGESESFVAGAGGSVRPTPSPDGRYLAFVRRTRGASAPGSLFLKDLVSGEETAICNRLDQDLQEVWAVHGVYPNMDWTPDSESIVFWAGGKIRRIDVDTLEVAEISFHVDDTRTVYEAPRPEVEVAPAEFDTQMVRNAAVSPDGSQVVFESTGRLYIKSMSGGEPRLLTSDPRDHFEFFPSWSRDGHTIVFVAWNDRTLGHIHSVRARGGRSTRLTRTPGHYLAPRFSPDGGTIVYGVADGGYLTSPDWSIETGVFSIPSQGGESRRITDDGSNPHFGARSGRLYVTREIDDVRSLVSIDLNGEAAHTHARGEYLEQFEVSPDGRHLAFRENFHVYALPLPPGGLALDLGTDVGSVPMTRASGDGGNYPNWSDGDRLHWSLGPVAFSAAVDELFKPSAENGDNGYAAPEEGVSLSMRLDADVPEGAVALTGARIVTMADGDGGVIEDGVIVTDGNRIRAVGSRDAVDIPAAAEVVDVSGMTVIPGLIDAHAHGPQGVEIIPQQNWSAYATLAFGVTTVHDPSNDAVEVFAASEMQRTGQILAPRIFSTGDVVYGARSTSFAKIDSLEDAREHVRRLKAQGAMSVKNYNQPRRDQRQQVAVAAREENMLVVTEGASLFHMDLSMVADGNSTIEHNLPQAMLYDDVLQFWEQTNVAYTPTLVVTYGGLSAETYWYQETRVWEHPILSNFVPPDILRPRSVRRTIAPESEYHHATSAATAKLLADRGVLVSIGAHGQREGLGSHWEIWSFVQGGMSPMEALRAATIVPATALGFADDLGSLEAGKLADLVVIDADILEDIQQTDKVSMVMLNGRLYDAATLNETVTGDRETRPFYWQR